MAHADPPPVPVWGGDTPGLAGPDRGREWRRPPVLPRRPRGRLLAGGAAAALLLGGWTLLVWVGMWWQPPRPVALVLVTAGYESNLSVPHNVYGKRTADRLAADPVDPIRPVARPLRLRLGDAWDGDLGAASAPSVLVYLALHGGADARGPYLLRDDADTRPAEENLVRVGDVLTRLAGLPAATHKLLVLDATQPTSDWPRGQLRNDFARALAELEPAVRGVPNLVVLSASGPDERSWPIPEYGETAFGYHLRRALAGDSDDTDHDSLVRFDEVADTVAGRVARWARVNRGVAQRPVLLPAGDEGRRRAARVVVGRHRGGDDDPPAAPAPLPPDLDAAWRAAGDLAVADPPPQTYSPGPWRQLLALLLRYEALSEAGDAENANRVRSQARSVEAGLRAGPLLNLTSVGNAIPMPAVVGLPYVTDPAAAAVADGLWQGTTADAAKRWQAALDQLADDPTAAARLRLALTRRAIEQAAADPGFRRDRVVPLLRLIEGPGRPRPVEAHYLLLYSRDKPDPPPPDDLVQLALETRLLAERAALGARAAGPGYPERVWPFAAADVEQADALRLRGQDLLLTTDPARWGEARAALSRAADGYRRGLGRAHGAAAALTARNRAFAELPFYCRALADAQRSDEPPSRERLEAAVAGAEAAWADAHRLDADLRSAAASAAPAAAAPGLEERAVALSDRLERFAVVFRERADQLAAVNLPGVWQAASAALEVPTLPVEVRARLRESKRRASWTLLTQSRGDAPQPVPAELTALRAEDAGRRSGRLALACLGRAVFDRPAAGVEGYELAAHRVRTFAADPDGWRSLQRAGADIGARFAAFPAWLDDLQQRAAALPGDAPLGPLAEADALARLAPAGTADDGAAAAVPRCRQAWLARLLVRQAERTWQEHWYPLDPADEPYYRRSGRMYAADAAPHGDRAAVAAVNARLDTPGNLRVTFDAPPGGVVVTTERRTDVTARVAAAPAAAVPPGDAVWTAVPGPGLSWAGPPGAARQAVAVGDAPGALTAPLANDLLAPSEADPPARPDPTASRLAVRALFRGQSIEATLPVAIYPRPVVTVNDFPSPRLASVAVRAAPEVFDRYGSASGAVAFVLDCSGSMGASAGQAFGPAAKYHQATAALEEVLRDLPAGPTVSVWAFGQASGAALTERDAERTIQRVVAPVRWDPADRGQLASMMARVRYPALVPWNESPVLRAMLEAKADLTDAGGFKTMVVVTDGMDNRYRTDRTLNPKGDKSVPDLIREEFRGSGVTVHVVGYKLPEKEEAEARKQFEAVRELDPPGSFSLVTDADALGRTLRRALRRNIRYWIEAEANTLTAGVGRAGLEVGTAGGGDRWFAPGLDPGGRKLRVLAEPFLVREAYLGPADRLLLDLRPGPDGLTLRRTAWAATDYPARPWAAARDWRLTVLQNQRPAAGVRLLAALERGFDPAEVTLQVPRPKEVWFELTPAGDGQRPAAVEWHAESGYPAAAWTLTSPGWPDAAAGPARPLVRAWWNPDQEPAIAGRLDRGVDFRTLADLTGRKLFVDGDPVTVESVSVEPHVVDTSPAARERMRCLTVRLVHDPANPVAVRARGFPALGRALWQYPAVGRTTALFWPAIGPDPSAALDAVEIISLRAFRREAERRGYAVTLPDLPAPDPGDERPRPPIPLP